MKIIYSRAVRIYLWELVETLYFKNYFGFKASARQYVLELVKNMEAPIYFSRYGKDLYYIVYSKNKRTSWYFFFTYHPENNTYFIRYITNNHVSGHLLE